ncbi:MAG: zinc ribbon domain-containing protein [Clostridia bacterium]|nr:zinc ribbon domain-containing protein [Clostridia bacterium]
MPLIELRCAHCGKVYEELVRANGEYPACKYCGGKTDQVYSGTLTVNSCKKSNCSGNCSTCGGCH